LHNDPPQKTTPVGGTAVSLAIAQQSVARYTLTARNLPTTGSVTMKKETASEYGPQFLKLKRYREM